ncbi:hypothetical protein E3A20_19050 [Planctomyces bekefii]|uniref:Metallo-beta-lactamase domain-containing protein n=1 Tax=Planctomyces bekefii TaxID=1653850 RepID=A0A5C6M2I7_9PLAN|nr:hypothetical protein E3A20_19050 [Planctomyces bekefii]
MGAASPVSVHIFNANKWRQNCYVLVDSAEGHALVIDPGFDVDDISAYIADRQLSVTAILATHTHFDHIAGAATLQDRFGGVKFLLHADEENILRDVNIYTMALRLPRIAAPNPRIHLQDQTKLRFSNCDVVAHHFPGHTPGGCAFAFENLLFTGDLLLRGQDNAPKLPGANKAQLKKSQDEIFSRFPGSMLVYPGHGRAVALSELHAYFTELQSSTKGLV